MQTKSLLEHALMFAEQGFYILPVRENSKIPAIPKWQKNASRDLEKIRNWWRENSKYNIGIFTGKYKDDQALCVLDVDVKKGKTGESALLKLREVISLPETWESKTPSGGRHLMFVVNKALRSPTNFPENGIDIRSGGAFIVAPSSKIDNKIYDFISEISPSLLPDALKEKIGQPSERKLNVSSNIIGTVDTETAVKDAIEYLKNHAPESFSGSGGNHKTYQVACNVKDLGISESKCLHLMFDYNSKKCLPEWSSEELSAIVRNAYHYGKSPIGSKSPEAYFSNLDSEIIQSKLTNVLPFVRFRDLSFESGPMPLVDKWLDNEGMSVLYGPSNNGKSLIALDLAFHIATGRRWYNNTVHQGAVLYVAAESPGSIKRRVLALKIHHKLEKEEVPLYVVTHPIRLLGERNDTAALIQSSLEIASEAKQPVRLIIIDTAAYALAGGDENSFIDMGAFIGHINEIRLNAKTHVMVIHHSGKDDQRGARGHSSLRAAIDTEIEVKNWIAKITKQRDGEKDLQIGFGMELVSVGSREDGKSVQAPIVTHTSLEDVLRSKPLKGQTFEAYNALRLLIQNHGITSPESMNLPSHVEVVRTKEWLNRFLKLPNISEKSIQTKSKERGFQRIKEELMKLGHIQILGEWVWIISRQDRDFSKFVSTLNHTT